MSYPYRAGASSLSLGLNCTADLLLVDLKGIAILHVELARKSSALTSHDKAGWAGRCRSGCRYTHSFWAIGWLYATSVEQESNGVRGLALPLAERIHQFLQRRCPLDLEEDLVVVVRNLDVEVLADGLSFRLLGRRGSVVV